MDGNFKAQRMNVSDPKDDVVLVDGEGYFVERRPYEEHLRSAEDIPYVSGMMMVQVKYYIDSGNKEPTCVDHKAANDSNFGHKNLDITGVMGCACARHGCFIPHSMTNMHKGERLAMVQNKEKEILLTGYGTKASV